MPTFKGDGDSIVLDQVGVSLQAAFSVSCANSTSALNGTTWTFSTNRNDYYVWYNVTDAAAGVSDPVLSGIGIIGIPVSLTTAEAGAASDIAAATATELAKLSEIGLNATQALLGASVAFSVTVREFGPVTAVGASNDTSSAINLVEDVVGVARKDVNVTFLNLDSNGSVVSVEGISVGASGAQTAETSTFEVSASTAVHTIAEINLFASGSLTLGLGSSLATITKSDNRPSQGVT